MAANVRPVTLSDKNRSWKSVELYLSSAMTEENAVSGGPGEYAVVPSEEEVSYIKASRTVTFDRPAEYGSAGEPKKVSGSDVDLAMEKTPVEPLEEPRKNDRTHPPQNAARYYCGKR